MTPTELNLKAKALLETHFEDIVLSGEISKITLHGSGHWYFDLKDERSSIACAMFKGANLKVGFKPVVGDFLELCGSVSLYPESGRYQFIATSMKKAGFGDLEAQFLALKERLQKEGLFDPRFKKSLPKFPKKVGIITSKTSAALYMNLWDKKAKTYARYQNTLNTIQKQTFEYLQNLKISFQDKSIIDIGCGTGVWTLHLAKEAKEILALDSANAMLEILQEDAKKLNLNNIKCKNLSFETWMQNNPNVKFDLAFLSMSPALQNEKDYTNFLNLAKIKIYLGWADYRKSDFLDPIFKYFNTEFKGFYKKDLENYLLEKNIFFHKIVFDETRKVQRTKEEAIENALWHLSMNKITASKETVSSFVENNITETIESKIKLLIINNL